MSGTGLERTNWPFWNILLIGLPFPSIAPAFLWRCPGEIKIRDERQYRAIPLFSLKPPMRGKKEELKKMKEKEEKKNISTRIHPNFDLPNCSHYMS